MATADGATPSAQDVYTRMKAEGAEEDDEEEEFVTASECTRSPSRSSSYHTASDGGGGGSGTGLNVAHWWQDDEVEEDDDSSPRVDETVRASELETSDKQADDESIPLPPPPPPLPSTLGKGGMFGRRGSSKGREITESTLTQLKVTQSHTLGITSYVLTSEVIKDSGKTEDDGVSSGLEQMQAKTTTDAASETSFGTSSMEQSSTENLLNGASVGALSEEELIRQMEEGTTGGGGGGSAANNEETTIVADSGTPDAAAEEEEGEGFGGASAANTASARAEWRRLCQEAAATRLQQEHGRT